MVHSEVYLNKYVVSIAPFSTAAFTPNTPIQKTAFLWGFRFLIFHPFFEGGQLTTFAPRADAHDLSRHLIQQSNSPHTSRSVQLF